jgi:hypothetical protein
MHEKRFKASGTERVFQLTKFLFKKGYWSRCIMLTLVARGKRGYWHYSCVSDVGLWVNKGP